MATSHSYLISDARKGGQEDQEDEEEVTSGATRSAHQQQPQESKDDSTTPDTEDYFSKGKLLNWIQLAGIEMFPAIYIQNGIPVLWMGISLIVY